MTGRRLSWTGQVFFIENVTREQVELKLCGASNLDLILGLLRDRYGPKLVDSGSPAWSLHTNQRRTVLNHPDVFLPRKGRDGRRINYCMAGIIGMNTVISDKSVWIGRK